MEPGQYRPNQSSFYLFTSSHGFILIISLDFQYFQLAKINHLKELITIEYSMRRFIWDEKLYNGSEIVRILNLTPWEFLHVFKLWEHIFAMMMGHIYLITNDLIQHAAD